MFDVIPRLLRPLLVVGLWLVPLAVGANAAKPIALSTEQTSAIEEISQYINGVKYLQGEFTQISPKGNMSRGVFFISRPGKMRFEYAPPNPFLIVADGKWLTIKNTKKEKGDQFPLCETPLKYLLCQDADILRGTNVLDFSESDGLVSVTLEEARGLFEGNITLVYDKNSKVLQQWVIVDGKGRRTTVALENVEAGVKPDPKLFVVKINRKEREAK